MLSALPEAKYLPSGENAMDKTFELWPIKSGYLSYYKLFLKSVSTNSQLFNLAPVIMQLFILVLVNLLPVKSHL